MAKRLDGNNIAGSIMKAVTGTNRAEVVNRLIIGAKCNGCIDCGKIYPPEIMDFDHVRGPRNFSPCIGTQLSVKLVTAEIAKCDVRCPTCHRMRHYWMKCPDDPIFTRYVIPVRWIEARQFLRDWHAE